MWHQAPTCGTGNSRVAPSSVVGFKPVPVGRFGSVDSDSVRSVPSAVTRFLNVETKVKSVARFRQRSLGFDSGHPVSRIHNLALYKPPAVRRYV
jgi:hypothetical protein